MSGNSRSRPRFLGPTRGTSYRANAARTSWRGVFSDQDSSGRTASGGHGNPGRPPTSQDAESRRGSRAGRHSISRRAMRRPVESRITPISRANPERFRECRVRLSTGRMAFAQRRASSFREFAERGVRWQPGQDPGHGQGGEDGTARHSVTREHSQRLSPFGMHATRPPTPPDGARAGPGMGTISARPRVPSDGYAHGSTVPPPCRIRIVSRAGM